MINYLHYSADYKTALDPALAMLSKLYFYFVCSIFF